MVSLGRGLEADEEADGGFGGTGAAGDGEIVLEEVGREVDELAEAEAHAEGAVGEVIFEAGLVVIGGAVLEGQALAAAGGGLEADGAAAGAEVGSDAEGVVLEVGDVAEGELADAGLDSAVRKLGLVMVVAVVVAYGDIVDGGGVGGGGEGVVLGVAEVAEVEFEADIRAWRCSAWCEFADGGAGLDVEQGAAGMRCVAHWMRWCGDVLASRCSMPETGVLISPTATRRGRLGKLLLKGGGRGGFLSDRRGCREGRGSTAEGPGQAGWFQQKQVGETKSA